MRAGEQVDMPVFFFLDPAMEDDPYMADVREITLSYTFFNARHADPTGGEVADTQLTT